MRVCVAIAGLLLATSAALAAADEKIIFIGSASIPGTATDKSGLTGTVLNNFEQATTIPANTFGGAGSAIDYSGADDLYLMASDRGPGNGDAHYLARVHAVRIVVHPGERVPVKAELQATTLLTSASGKHFTGSSAAFIGAMGYSEKEDLRLDPEGIRFTRDGSGAFWISDEYGPYIVKFASNGRKLDSFTLPSKYAVPISSAVAEAELSLNTTGRQSNRGMEGLAITPDGKMLVGLMQSCLIQDHGLDASLKRVSSVTRLITMNLQDRSTQEYVYPLDSDKMGVNEILAINDHQFLVIERDSKEGIDAKAKFIEKIDLTGATNISKPFEVGGKQYDYSGTTADNGLPAGPASKIPGITPVAKTLFLDMLSPAGGIGGAELPEKMEGLAWGPDFENGDKLLIVTSDNDFRPEQPTYFYAYRVSLKK